MAMRVGIALYRLLNQQKSLFFVTTYPVILYKNFQVSVKPNAVLELKIQILVEQRERADEQKIFNGGMNDMTQYRLIKEELEVIFAQIIR